MSLTLTGLPRYKISLIIIVSGIYMQVCHFASVFVCVYARAHAFLLHFIVNQSSRLQRCQTSKLLSVFTSPKGSSGSTLCGHRLTSRFQISLSSLLNLFAPASFHECSPEIWLASLTTVTCSKPTRVIGWKPIGIRQKLASDSSDKVTDGGRRFDSAFPHAMPKPRCVVRSSKPWELTVC